MYSIEGCAAVTEIKAVQKKQSTNKDQELRTSVLHSLIRTV